MFESALIGPQLVSPSTRRPTSMSGTDSAAEITVIHTGMSNNAVLDDAQRERRERTTPIATHLSGNSSPSIESRRQRR